jgi:hypothetical protein
MVREGSVETPEVLIVVGAHLEAEVADRPLAYAVRERLLDEAARIGAPELSAVVCTDLWYLNNEDLFSRPCVVIGHPGVNAAAAYYARRLPAAFVVDGRMQVQADPEFLDLRVCIYGMSEADTAGALEAFWSRWGEGYVAAVVDEMMGTPNF